MDEPILELEDVSRRYGATLAVDSAAMALRAGRIACLLGPSGCGKSTLLRMIAGLEPVDAGRISIAGAVASEVGTLVAPERRGVGLVFQDNALFPHLDVRSNVGFGLAGMPRAARDERVERLLDQFHIGHLAPRWPHMLSGGEQQRVAIARALAREPALLLLDEPFSGLDGSLRQSVREALIADLRAAGATVLIVTHDPQEAMALADDLMLMAGGRLLQTGTPEECYRRPVSATAARLLGDVIALEGQVAAGAIRTVLGDAPAPGLAEGAAVLLLRPEHVRIAAEGAEGTITAARFAGDTMRVEIDLAGTKVALRLTGEPPAAGTRVRLVFDPAAAQVLASGARDPGG